MIYLGKRIKCNNSIYKKAQLIAIIVRLITQRHKYRWHVTTDTVMIAKVIEFLICLLMSNMTDLLTS